MSLEPPPGTPSVEFLNRWTDDHVANWLAEIKCGPYADTFKEHDIRGDILLELDHDTLRELNVASVGDRLRILSAVKALRLKYKHTGTRPPKRPAPLVLSQTHPSPDLPRVIREPVRPLPQPVAASPPASSRPSLPPAPRAQQPQPPRSTPRIHPLTGSRARTPNQADAAPYTNSPLPAPPAHSLLTPGTSNTTWQYGLPPDPRAGSKQTIRSPSPLRPPNGAAHGRNISFGGLSSPMASAPTAKLPPRPSTSGTTQHPYASVQPPLTNAALSPIVEAFPSPSNPASPAFTVGRGPFHPPSHNQQLSLDDLRRKLVKFILPDEGRSCVVDVADCAGGVEIMEKVLRKFDKVATRKKEDAANIVNRIETDDGGLCVDGWCVYLESDDQPDNGPSHVTSRSRLLTRLQ